MREILKTLEARKSALENELAEINAKISAIARMNELEAELSELRSRFPDLCGSGTNVNSTGHNPFLDIPNPFADSTEHNPFLDTPTDQPSNSNDDEWGGTVSFSVSAIADDNAPIINEQSITVTNTASNSANIDDEWGGAVNASVSAIADDKAPSSGQSTVANSPSGEDEWGDAITLTNNNKPPFTLEELNAEYHSDSRFNFNEQLNHGDEVLHAPTGSIGKIFAPPDELSAIAIRHNEKIGYVTVDFNDGRRLPFPKSEVTKNLTLNLKTSYF